MPKRRSPFRNESELLAFRLARASLRALPLETAEAFGRALGRVYRRLDGKRRELVRDGLARAFPDRTPSELEALEVAVFEHFGGLAADLVWTTREPIESLLARVEVVNAEGARSAFETRRGVFFLTAHLGSWEYAALVVGALGIPLTVIARPLDNDRLEPLLRGFRTASGNAVQPKADAAREILRVLRKGATIGILSDQRARPPDAALVPFFGRPAATTTAVARFADRTEALIVPTTAIRIAPGRYRLEFRQALDVRTLDASDRTPTALTARLNAILEGLIREHPDQWLWLHDRWRLD